MVGRSKHGSAPPPRLEQHRTPVPHIPVRLDWTDCTQKQQACPWPGPPVVDDSGGGWLIVGLARLLRRLGGPASQHGMGQNVGLGASASLGVRVQEEAWHIRQACLLTSRQLLQTLS